MELVIGRSEEKKILKKLEKSNDSELVAVYGRRRVGKTFLIRNGFSKKLTFEFSGSHHATLNQQLENFSSALTNSIGGLPIAIPANWKKAFDLLIQVLESKSKKEKTIVFFDEFPWIDTPKSGFLSAFEHFWNTWASLQKNLIVVICGSAAAWMIKKIVRNKGGLHNRVTCRIRLLPFTIGETEAFLKHRNVKLDRYQLLQLYMSLGGIPQYLKEIEPGQSVPQAIDQLCFTKDGLLNDEFKTLYHSLFNSPQNHIAVVKLLAKNGKGLSRQEIIEKGKLESGGHATQILEELSESGFISPYIPFGKNNNSALYRLTDEYSLFYLKFIEGAKTTSSGTWLKLSAGRSWTSWSGFAYESVCMKHREQLKKGLGISDVISEVSVWRYRPKTDTEKGAQIDLLIDRNDHCINVCEMKFSSNEFEIQKSYAKELEEKLQVFQTQSKTKKSLFLTLITTFGVKNATSYPGLVQKEISMNTLFEK